jgi:hypothetical protein
LVQGVLRGVNGIQEFDENFAGIDVELALFHDAMGAGTGYRNNWDARLDGHDRSSLLEWLEAAIGTAGAFRIDEEGLAVAQGFDGFVDAFDGGVAMETIDGDEVRKMEGLADDGPVEERALEENGDATRNGADDGRGVRGTGVIRGENAGTGRDALDAFYFHVNADAVHEEHYASYASPVERIDMFGEESVDEQGRASDQNVEAEKNGNEGGTEHGLRMIFVETAEDGKGRVGRAWHAGNPKTHARKTRME